MSMPCCYNQPRFGINHLHNEMKPEEVAKLSPEQAMAHYKEKYWKPMGIDNMSPDMQIVAFDAAVQHGADADTKKMIEESGGDAEKLIELRRDYYLQLAKQNPEKNGPQLRGWMNRLGQIKSQVEAARGAMPTLEEAYAQIDANTTNPEVATKAKAEYKSRLDAFEGARKQREDDAARQVAEYESRGETPPATLLAEMNPQKQIDRQKKDYDPKEYERVRTQISYGQPIDLEHGIECDSGFVQFLLAPLVDHQRFGIVGRQDHRYARSFWVIRCDAVGP